MKIRCDILVFQVDHGDHNDSSTEISEKQNCAAHCLPSFEVLLLIKNFWPSLSHSAPSAGVVLPEPMGNNSITLTVTLIVFSPPCYCFCN